MFYYYYPWMVRMSVRPSFKYTFDVDNSDVSSTSYDIYYITSHENLEYVVRYQVTEDESSRKETKREED